MKPAPTLDEIEAMDRAALIAAWHDIFRTPVPRRLSAPFLRRFLAFECQARRGTGLPAGFVARLARSAKQKPTSVSTAVKPGGRLVREWNGVTHVVEVTEQGFLWNGQSFASLSHVARAITGARWSGPRFFGLRSAS